MLCAPAISSSASDLSFHGHDVPPKPKPDPSSVAAGKKGGGSAPGLDALETGRNAALEQRPVEAERQRQIAAVDHLIGLLGGARHASDRHTALQYAGLRARHQRLHF